MRLKANTDISGFSPTNRVILQALKTYGLILADYGNGDWSVSGAPDAHWNNLRLQQTTKLVHGSDFEVVDVSPLMVDENSGLAAPTASLDGAAPAPGGPTSCLARPRRMTWSPPPYCACGWLFASAVSADKFFLVSAAGLACARYRAVVA